MILEMAPKRNYDHEGNAEGPLGLFAVGGGGTSSCQYFNLQLLALPYL